MGGDTVLVAGDIRQTLPAVSRETRANEVTACIKSSYLWPQIIKRSLKKSMRGRIVFKIAITNWKRKYPESEGKITLPSEFGILI